MACSMDGFTTTTYTTTTNIYLESNIQKKFNSGDIAVIFSDKYMEL